MRYARLFIILTTLLLSGIVPAVWGDDAQGQRLGLPNPFFAFDNGTGRGQLSPEKQAQMLAELGYDGIGYTGTAGIGQMLDALDKHNLKMFSIYVGVVLGADGPSIDPGLPQAFQDLKGRKTIIWLTIRGSASDAEDQAIEAARQVAELAAQSDLRVALYPHFGFYVDRVETAVRIAEKADRENLGASLNLCHFLRAGDGANLDRRLRPAMPHLMLVSINGADHEGNWDRLIQTLDRGDYDVYAVLVKLRRLGYDGPVGLQCYQVPGDRRENLKRSIQAWEGFVKRMDQKAR